jgi:hypothetical protein
MWLRYENRELAQFGGKNGAAPRMKAPGKPTK